MAHTFALVKTYWMTVAGALFVLAAWEFISRVGLAPSFLLPAPSAIARAGVEFWRLLLSDAAITTSEILLGFAAGSVVGLIFGIGIVMWRPIEQIVYPVAIVTQVVPKLAIAPLFVVWFGTGLAPKIMITLLMCLFPVLVNTVIGLRSTDPRMLELMKSANANRWHVFSKVEFPTAAPYIFAGLKVGITLAVVGAVVGEWLGANEGLGYRVLAANSALRTDLLFMALFILSILGMFLFGLLVVAEIMFLPGSRRIDTTTTATL